MAKDFRDITLALAGICQASRLVQQIAYQGNANENDVEVMVNSVFNLNPTSTLDVYGNQISHLKLGFQTLKAIHQAVRREKLTLELMTYQQGLINLERLINRNDDYSSHLSQKNFSIRSPKKVILNLCLKVYLMHLRAFMLMPLALLALAFRFMALLIF